MKAIVLLSILSSGCADFPLTLPAREAQDFRACGWKPPVEECAVRAAMIRYRWRF